MFSTPDEIDPRLRVNLEEEGRRRTGQLDVLLTQAERLGEWQGMSVPEELRAYLAGQERDTALELARLLISWRRLGGTIALGHAAESEKPVPAPAAGQVLALRPDALEDELPTDRIPNGKPSPAGVGLTMVNEPLPQGSVTLRSAMGSTETLRPAILASSEALQGLKAHVETGGGFRVQAPAADWPARLAEQLGELLPAPREAPEAELGAILRVVDALERWRQLPPEVQATLVGLLAARLRALQEHPGFLADRRVDFAFGTLSAYVKRARPGYVYGLARWHQPNRGTWEQDAEAIYERLASMVPDPTEEPNKHKQLDTIEALVREVDVAPEEARSAVLAQLRREVLTALSLGVPARNPRLVRILTPFVDQFEGSEFRTLRRAVREEQDEARAEEEEESGVEEHLPADWAWWGFTRARRALIIGGDPREPSRQRLERAFGFAELEWVGAEYKRNNLLGVRERVRAGKVDLVILLTRFTGHDADQIIIPACRETGVGFVCVQHGYGVVRVRHAIERFLDPDERRRV